MRELVRTFRFAPYLPGRGPWFTLEVYDENRRDERGAPVTGYRLTQYPDRIVLFDGADHSGWGAVDSEATAESIMSFLTLKPGDTDAEYFDRYTPIQMQFAESHAEQLSCCVSDRWCDPETGGFNPTAARNARRKYNRKAARAAQLNGGRYA